MKKIMMIGCGAMGGAILSGCLSKGLWTKEEVYICLLYTSDAADEL